MMELDIDDDFGDPGGPSAFHLEVLVGDGLDFSVDWVAGEVQGLAPAGGTYLALVDRVDVEPRAEEVFR